MARRQAWKRDNFVRRAPQIVRFCRKYGFDLQDFNNGYQLRIEGVLDVYPVRGRWHWIPTGERGDFDTPQDLRKVLLSKTEDNSMAKAKTTASKTKSTPRKRTTKPLSKSEERRLRATAKLPVADDDTPFLLDPELQPSRTRTTRVRVSAESQPTSRTGMTTADWVFIIVILAIAFLLGAWIF